MSSRTIRLGHWARVLLAVAFVLLGPACGADADSNSDTDGFAIRDVVTGQCLVPANDDLFVGAVELPACDEPHAMEVIGTFEMADGDYPGNSSLLRSSYRDCQPFFETYVGLPFWESRYDILTITPSFSSWAQGDRVVICTVVEVDGTMLTGTVQGIAR